MTDDSNNATEQRTDEQHRETDYEHGGRYGAFETADDDVLVYDRENPEAWLQADVGVPLPVVR